MALALAVICCLGSGYMAVALGLPQSAHSVYQRLLRASLSAGFGLGIFSVIFFFARVLGLNHFLAIDVLALALFAAAFFLLRARSKQVVIRTGIPESIDLPRWLRRVLIAAFGFALASALYSAILRSIAHSHGEGWDAFAIWNLHARFLFRGGEYWRDGFSPLIPWSHPDYPLLLPSAIAHFWNVLGQESAAVPALIGLVFTFCTLGLLLSSIAVLRGSMFAMLGGLALVSTPFFVEQGSSQYADVPLSFFFLAVIVLLRLDGGHRSDQSLYRSQNMLVLAGVAAGFAIWTKNEGILFVVACVVAQITMRGPQWMRRLALFILGAGPFLILVLWFKHSVAFPSELFSNQTNMLHAALDPARYRAILQWFVKDFLRFGEWYLIPGTLVLVFLYFVVAGKYNSQNSQQLCALALPLALTLAGYFVIYVITPYDLHWHLRFSLNRLFLQLWPGTVFVFFLAIPREVGEKSQNGTKFAQN